jgi:hypothetical protein
MKIQITVEIDEEAYAEEYSLDPSQVKADAQVHLKDLLEGKLIELHYASKKLMKEHYKQYNY